MPSKPKIFIGLPIRRDISPLFMNAMFALAQSKVCDFVVAQEMGCPWVGNARNALTGDFLESDCSHLLFIDDDIIFTPQDVATLISRNVPIVTGFYAKKTDGKLEWAHCGLEGAEGEMMGDLVQVRYAGAGFVLIARDVFDAMLRKSEFLDIRYYKNGSLREGRKHEREFWSEGTYPRKLNGQWTWLGEDAYFFQRATDCGFRIWADTKVVPAHLGTVAFPLKHQRAQLFPIETPAMPEPKSEPVTINQR